MNHEVIDRPVEPNVPYSHTRRTEEGIPNEQGELEYFVQIANVAPDATATLPADFTLRVDVENFSSTETEPSPGPPILNVPQPQTPRHSLNLQTKPESEPSDTVIAAGLPPGFEVHGPGRWACVGGDDARGSFTIITPDGRADQIERMLPQALKNLEKDLNRAEIQAHAVGEEELERVQRDRDAFETGMQQLVEDSGAATNIALAVDASRRENETLIMARLYGRTAGGDCHVEFSATLPGWQPAAQQLAGDRFSVSVTPESINVARAGLQNVVQTLDPSIFDFSNVTEANAENMAHQMEQLKQQLSGNVVIPDMEWTDCGNSMRGCKCRRPRP